MADLNVGDRIPVYACGFGIVKETFPEGANVIVGYWYAKDDRKKTNPIPIWRFVSG